MGDALENTNLRAQCCGRADAELHEPSRDSQKLWTKAIAESHALQAQSLDFWSWLQLGLHPGPTQDVTPRAHFSVFQTPSWDAEPGRLHPGVTYFLAGALLRPFQGLCAWSIGLQLKQGATELARDGGPRSSPHRDSSWRWKLPPGSRPPTWQPLPAKAEGQIGFKSRPRSRAAAFLALLFAL